MFCCFIPFILFFERLYMVNGIKIAAIGMTIAAIEYLYFNVFSIE